MRRSAAGLALSAGLLGAVLLAGCGGSSGSGSDVPTGDVAVVDGQNITVADLQTTMNIARLSLKTSYPEPGTEDWVSLRSRALESLAHDAELRAWAHNLGVTVKPSAVDAAVKTTLVERVPRHARRARIDQAKVDAEFKSTGMTRALFRSRTETKLLAQAAANKVAKSPECHRRAGQGAVREGQVDHLRAARAPQAAPHPRQGQGARRPAVRAARSPRTRASPSSPRSTRPTAARPIGGELGVPEPHQSRQAVRRRRLHASARASSRSRSRRSSAGT